MKDSVRQNKTLSQPTRQLRVLNEDMDPQLLRVAFASTDRRRINQHFGSTRSLVIYGVSVEQIILLSVAEFAEQEQDRQEDKLVAKLEYLRGCIAVYCCACGASAVRQLLSLGVQPVKVYEDVNIEEALQALQVELREEPSAWLVQAMMRHRKEISATRFDAMEREGW